MWSTAVLKHLRTEAFRYSSTEAHVLNGYFRILPQSISYNKHLDIKKKNQTKQSKWIPQRNYVCHLLSFSFWSIWTIISFLHKSHLFMHYIRLQIEAFLFSHHLFPFFLSIILTLRRFNPLSFSQGENQEAWECGVFPASHQVASLQSEVGLVALLHNHQAGIGGGFSGHVLVPGECRNHWPAVHHQANLRDGNQRD